MLIVDRKLDRPLPEFKDRRCFIVGSGPSLDSLDLSLLRGSLVFALNAAITLFDDDAYWFLRDRRAIAEIMPRLTGRDTLRVITTIKCYDGLQSVAQRRRSIRAYLYDERSVTHERTVAEDALQLAKKAGCADAVLVGVDCSAPPGRPYAAALDWKPCAWYDRKDPVPESKACASFLRALRALAASERLDGLPVYSTSATCDAFPFLEFSSAVPRRVDKAV